MRTLFVKPGATRRRSIRPRSTPSQRSCVEPLDLAFVSAIVRSVSSNVRRTTAPVSISLRRKPALIARRAVHHCASLQLAAKLKTPLQIGQHLVRAFEAGFEIAAKPIDVSVINAVLSTQLDDLEPRLTRNGYDLRSLVEQFDAKPAEIRRLLRGDLDPSRAQELIDAMRAAGLPT